MSLPNWRFDIEAYIASLTWDSDTPQEIRGLVEGNLRGLHAAMEVAFQSERETTLRATLLLLPDTSKEASQ